MIETRGPGARSGFEKQKPHYFTKDNVTRRVGSGVRAVLWAPGNANRGGGYSCCSSFTPSRWPRLTGGARVATRACRALARALGFARLTTTDLP